MITFKRFIRQAQQILLLEDLLEAEMRYIGQMSARYHGQRKQIIEEFEKQIELDKCLLSEVAGLKLAIDIIKKGNYQKNETSITNSADEGTKTTNSEGI